VCVEVNEDPHYQRQNDGRVSMADTDRLCAEGLRFGGSVWSPYNQRRRRAAPFSSAAAARLSQ